MVTLTGTFTRLDGTPATGTVRVTPSRSPIMDPDGKIVISGPQVFPLDKDGKLTTEIPASDDPDLGPAFTYAVDVNLAHASWKISKVWIPHGTGTVDLSEIGDYQPVPGVATRVVTIPADGTDGQVLVWDGAGFSWDFPPEGPQGPPGEVTTAALTAALAGKVTGTGMTLRRDTTVGTRVFLDHPGGSTMLWGDTGWRALSTWTSAGTIAGLPLASESWEPTPGQAGGIYVRRNRDKLRIIISGLTRTTATTAAVFANPNPIPSGFRPQSVETLIGLRSPTEFAALSLRTNGDLARLSGGMAGANGLIDIKAEVEAETSWPTTLPGIPS